MLNHDACVISHREVLFQVRGVLHYRKRERKNTYRIVDLSFCLEDDPGIPSGVSLGVLRRKKLKRILAEAEIQNVRLSCKDISLIFSTSPSTVKRDLTLLKKG